MRNGRPPRIAARGRGFTYLTALFLVALMGLALAATGEVWQISAQREKEIELLFVGKQYRKAIELYVKSSLGVARYPRQLEDLLKDPRKPETQRYLRRLYADPVTGKNEWGLVRAADGGIAGVFSLSEDTPLKVSGFRPEDAVLAGRTKYMDWKFEYIAGVPVTAPAPAK